MSVNENGYDVSWKSQSCLASDIDGVLCTKKQSPNLFIGCYVSPGYEFEGTILKSISEGQLDSIMFCKQSCLEENARYFLLTNKLDNCYCVVTSNIPKGGLVEDSQCELDTCSEDLEQGHCNPDDGYVRAYLYKTYDLTCPPLAPDLDFNFFFPWDYHGQWHLGSFATVKCLPGYKLPDDISEFNGTNTALPELNYDENSQTTNCSYDPFKGGIWYPEFIPCIPVICKNANKFLPLDTIMKVNFNPSGYSDDHYFETDISLECPANKSIPDLLLDEMSFDYSDSFGIVQLINLTCNHNG